MKNISTKELILAALFASITAVLAFISIRLPFSPVPVTGQTLGVMLAGALLGSKLGALSQTVYLLLGIIGLPVFSGGASGFGALIGPTGGFLFGFPIGAYVTGLIIEKLKKTSLFNIALAVTTGGILAVYVPGIIQLGLFVEGGIVGAATMMLLYIPGDILKAIASTLVVKAFKHKGILGIVRQAHL